VDPFDAMERVLCTEDGRPPPNEQRHGCYDEVQRP
jgi:hypothetical protein